jgi:hypothetical protein
MAQHPGDRKASKAVVAAAQPLSDSTAPAKKRSLFATFLCGFCDNVDRGRVLRLGDLASPIATPSQNLPPAFIYADARPEENLRRGTLPARPARPTAREYPLGGKSWTSCRFVRRAEGFRATVRRPPATANPVEKS